MMDKPKTRVRNQVGDIRFGASDEIVQAEDVPALFDQVIAKVRTEKTRSACYHRSQ